MFVYGDAKGSEAALVALAGATVEVLVWGSEVLGWGSEVLVSGSEMLLFVAGTAGSYGQAASRF